jgi:hypothetical protein
MSAWAGLGRRQALPPKVEERHAFRSDPLVAEPMTRSYPALSLYVPFGQSVGY